MFAIIFWGGKKTDLRVGSVCFFAKDIRYQSAGEENAGPSLVLVHGFGGNADHWRKNTAELASNGFRVFAIDLIGYGYSDKPDPQSMQAVNGELKRDLGSYMRFAKEGGTTYGKVGDTHFTDMAHPLGSGYNFYTWADQLMDFSKDIVKSNDGIFAVCNSIGSCAGLQMAVDAPDMVNGVVICDPSLRMLNVKRQNPLGVPLISAFQVRLFLPPLAHHCLCIVLSQLSWI
jgi:pimeloyl-ACP methyl ester carboxylesterase